MDNFRFANLPSHSSVVAGVTTLVSAWFLVAAGTIITDPHSEALRVDPPREAHADASIPDAARLQIVVTASRSASL
jgi:hypothetical protein